jgi:hypothetical protein
VTRTSKVHFDLCILKVLWTHVLSISLSREQKPITRAEGFLYIPLHDFFLYRFSALHLWRGNFAKVTWNVRPLRWFLFFLLVLLFTLYQRGVEASLILLLSFPANATFTLVKGVSISSVSQMCQTQLYIFNLHQTLRCWNFPSKFAVVLY